MPKRKFFLGFLLLLSDSGHKTLTMGNTRHWLVTVLLDSVQLGHSRYTFAHNLIEHQKSVSIDCYIALADEFSTVYYCCLTALGSVKMLSNKKHSFTVCLFFMIYLPSCHILNCFCSVRTFHWHDTLHFICRCLTSKMDFF